jgi:ClpP class serine protease
MANILKKLFLIQVAKFKVNYSKLNPRNITWMGFKKFLKGLSSLIVLFGAIIVIISSFTPDSSDTDSSVAGTADETSQSGENCNTTGIELHGTIDTYITASSSDQDTTEVTDATASEEVVGAINLAEKNEKIKAIILEVDSYGGYPVAAEEIAQAMNRATKPTVAFIRKAGVSAAYWSATGAQIIFASANSEVGVTC